MSAQNSWPLDSSEHLEQALREQGETPEDVTKLLPTLLELRTWGAPVPTSATKQNLLSLLMPLLADLSPVRRALRMRRHDAQGRLLTFIEVARAQVSILQLSFWLLSAFVTLLGFLAHFVIPTYALILQVSGPLLAYLGTIGVFRGVRLRMLEFELSCPPSPQQLTLARLLVVLLYDSGLSLLLNVLLLTRGGENFFVLTLSWLMPLLLVTGLTLLLSLRLSIYVAATIAYISWLGILALSVLGHGPGLALLSLPIIGELIIGLIGVVFLVIALYNIPIALARQLAV